MRDVGSVSRPGSRYISDFRYRLLAIFELVEALRDEATKA